MNIDLFELCFQYASSHVKLLFLQESGCEIWTQIFCMIPILQPSHLNFKLVERVHGDLFMLSAQYDVECKSFVDVECESFVVSFANLVSLNEVFHFFKGSKRDALFILGRLARSFYISLAFFSGKSMLDSFFYYKRNTFI